MKNKKIFDIEIFLNKKIFFFFNIFNILLFFTYSDNSQASSWTREASGYSNTEDFYLSNGAKVIHYKNNTTWKDSMGNYGVSKCFGLIVTDKSNNIIDYEMYCNYIDQDNDKFTQKYFRETDLVVGIGTSNTIDTQGKWREFINSNCNYAINYIKKAFFLKEKCKI